MSNPTNSTNLTLSEKDYNRLKKIKKVNNWTFNETVNKLCELEFKNNYIMQVREYMLITKTTEKIFKATFKKENMVIEYYNSRKGFDLKIENWGLNTHITNKFFEFINEDYARCMLEHLPLSIEFEDFIIQKI